jgi:YrbI family 3-deoxy-D-manno-octulosonate 8-phosphate phosphatase
VSPGSGRDQNPRAVRTACIIPARGGSKRLPRKNLRLVAGKPLLVHSVEHARVAVNVERTIVTTDDPEIAAVAREGGVEVVMRPPEIASDTATSEAALAHVLDILAATEQYQPDLVVFLQCTSPVRRPDDIDRAVETLLKDNADSLFSATESRWLIWRRDGPEVRSFNYDFRNRKRDQEHPDEYRENGSIYVFKPWVLRELNNRLGGGMTIYPMDYWSSFQVDSLEDLALVDWILRERRFMASQGRLPRRPALVVFDFDGVMTDNRVFVLQDGTEGVLCNRADGLGLEMLRRAGLPVLVLSREANPVVQARCAKLGIPYLQGVGDKWGALRTYVAQHGYVAADVVFVGNDVNDLVCLANVGFSVAVADADERVRAAAKFVLRGRGGYGAVRELCELLLANLS